MSMEWQLRRQIAETARNVYERGFVSATDGNVSARVMGDRMFITPAGSCLGEVRASDLLYADFSGNVLSGEGHPSSELPLHVTVYQQRSDVAAVIHAHPVAAVSCTTAGISLERPVVPEGVVLLGPIPTAPYATLSTQESADAIRDLIRRHDAVMLDRHGAVTVGATLVDAFRNLEKLEYCARVVWMAAQMGEVRQLTPEQVAKLEALARGAGAPGAGGLSPSAGTRHRRPI